MIGHTNFSTADWAIVVGFLVISTGLGMWAWRYMRNMEAYVVAGRAVRPYLGVASIIASEMGLVTVMYSAEKGYTTGFAAFYLALSAAVASLVVGLTGFIIVPLRARGVMTIPEFYEQRFGRDVRVCGGLILAFSGILNMGMFLKADSLFVTSVMGMLSGEQLKLAMTVMLGLVLTYTLLGGMISVLITDYMQFVIMSIALVAVSVFLMAQFSWGQLVSTVEAQKGLAAIDPLAPGGMGPVYMIWMAFLGLIGACVWQTSVMRAASAEDTRTVRITFSWGSLGFLIRFMVPYFWGICAFAYLLQRPDLLGEGVPDQSLRAMPVALANLLPMGAIGVLTAGMLAAAMSTYNTYLHTWSAVLTQDLVAPLAHRELGSTQRIWIARGIMLLIGVFLLVWGLWYPLGQHLWDYMAVTGAIYFTGAFAVLTAGLYWKRASRVGAYAAFACGFLNIISLTPVADALGIQRESGMLYSAIVGLSCAALAGVAMVAGSLLFPDRRSDASQEVA
ncbi:MAG TPA: sodium:solute symporter family protein [Armatimonadota bacterium]|nr:sodium:solute symporter family protein [Armatimonadota bacterium]